MPAIIFVGDLHLGRRPARLPEDLAEFGVEQRELGPRAAWRTVVERAVRDGIDVLVLAGDVVESDNARFEALGPLCEGVARLVAAGIRVFAVAGNHDVHALPRLVEQIPEFRLLGQGGTWETVPLRRAGGATWAYLAGWSYPEVRVHTNPLDLADVPRPSDDGKPMFGVLHCDLLSRDSPYAPVAAADLARTALHGWFLGHVHKPSPLDADRPPIGYLGSVVGLGPGEIGPRGVWRVRVDEDGVFDVAHLPLAPLRWEELSLDVGGLADADRVFEAVPAAIRDLHRRLTDGNPAPRAVGCQLRLVGATTEHRELRRELDRRAVTDLRLPLDGVVYFVHRVIDESRPRLDLTRLARDDHPAALLARRILCLEQGGEAAADMIREARVELETVADSRTWSLAPPDELSDERVRGLLVRAALTALDELLAQTDAGEPVEAP